MEGEGVMMAFELVKGDIVALELDDGVITTFESGEWDIVTGNGKWTCSFVYGKWKYIVPFEVCFEVDGVENVE